MSLTVQKKVLRIHVTPSAKSAVEKFADKNGMKQESVASRLYEWFGGQDDIVQRILTGLLGDAEPHAIRLMLERMAAGTPPERASPSFRPASTPPAVPSNATKGTREAKSRQKSA